MRGDRIWDFYREGFGRNRIQKLELETDMKQHVGEVGWGGDVYGLEIEIVSANCVSFFILIWQIVIVDG